MLLYIGIASVALVGIASLASDFGLTQMAKMELQASVDAAARAAASELPSITNSQSSAQAIGNKNTFAGNPLNLNTTTELEYVSWDRTTGSYTVLTGNSRSNANAIRINVQRQVPLTLARAVGMNQVTLRASSIALMEDENYGVIGLEYIKMSGNSANSYYSVNGTNPSTFGDRGNVASNGDITLSGSSSIRGNARPGIGKQVIGSSSVTGSTRPLERVLSFPNGDAGSYRFVNDNGNVPNSAMAASSFQLGNNKSLILPGGNYYFNNFSTGGGSDLSFTGAATIYVYGNFDMKGRTSTSGNLPGNLRVVMVPNGSGNPPGTLEIGSSAALYADVYAPQSRITLSGSGDIYGSVLGKSIDMTGSSAIHFDRSLFNISTDVLTVR